MFDFSDAAFGIRNLTMTDPNQIELDLITVQWPGGSPWADDPLIGCIEVKLANRNPHNQASELVNQLEMRHKKRCFNRLSGMMDDASGIDWASFPAWSGFLEATKRNPRTGSGRAIARRFPEDLSVSDGKERSHLRRLVRQFYETAMRVGEKVIFLKCQLPACRLFYGFGLGEAPPIEPRFWDRHSIYCKESKATGKMYAYGHREFRVGPKVYVAQRDFAWLN